MRQLEEVIAVHAIPVIIYALRALYVSLRPIAREGATLEPKLFGPSATLFSPDETGQLCALAAMM